MLSPAANPQRVEYFKGSKLVDALLGPRYKGKLAKDTPIKSRAEAAKLAQELLRVGFIHRSQRFQHAHSRRWELELMQGPFEEDGLFTWVYEGAQQRCRYCSQHRWQQEKGRRQQRLEQWLLLLWLLLWRWRWRRKRVQSPASSPHVDS